MKFYGPMLVAGVAGTFAVAASLLPPNVYAQDKAPSGKPFNPDISTVVTGLYQNVKKDGEKKPEPDSGLSLEEVELQIMADVDQNLRAVALLSVHKAEADAPAPGAAPGTAAPAEPSETQWAVEPEEAYVETIALPYVTIRAGKFKVALGRQNQLHAHAFPFIDAPLVHQSLLGGDGLNETGISAAVLLPLPWFAEVTAQGVEGDSPTLFSAETPGAAAGIYRLRNLWDLSDALTFDLGLSAANGANFWGGHSKVQGADLMLKWRPTKGGKSASFALAGEYLKGDVEGREVDPKIDGYAYWAVYQLSERWRVEARNEAFRAGTSDEKKTTGKYSALLGVAPSEFSDFRLQIDQEKAQDDKAVRRIALQMNVTIGAHPAHSY